jgi:hypothetical protein
MIKLYLQKWAEHFNSVASSRIDSVRELEDLKLKVDGLLPSSFKNEEYLLDVPFTAEEVHAAVRKLKGREAAGPDGITAEHLKYAGQNMVIWLMKITNSIIDHTGFHEGGCSWACL